MKYFFKDIENQKKLKRILKEWEGTPYRHWSGVKQGGCDCIHFVVKVLEEFGFGPFKIQKYPRDWHLHRDEERLLNGIRIALNGKVEEYKERKDALVIPINGDIILYQFGKVISHAGIYFDNHVYQSLNNIGIQKRKWADKTWYKRMKYIHRLLA